MNREVIAWLESPEGEAWSRDRHIRSPYQGALISVIEDMPALAPTPHSDGIAAVVAVLWHQTPDPSRMH